METNQDPTEPVLLLNEKDNVAVARLPIAAGTEVVANGHKVTARENIAPGHKIALKPIPENATITKYGESIGKATREIAPGEWVHTHNVAPDFGGKDYEYATRAPVDRILFARRGRDVHGLRARKRRRGHAQLHCGHRHVELFQPRRDGDRRGFEECRPRHSRS